MISCVEYSMNFIATSGVPAFDPNFGYFYTTEFERCKQRAKELLLKYDKILTSTTPVKHTNAFLELGEPRDVIVDKVDEWKIDTLVIGSRGMGTIKRLILGSVSDHCIHNAKCAVVVVWPTKEQEDQAKRTPASTTKETPKEEQSTTTEKK
jgi:nucleotide-binding universal stress UspA family protein